MHTIKTHPSTPLLKSALQRSSKACRWSRALSYGPTWAESPEKRTAMHHKNTKHMGQLIIIYILYNYYNMGCGWPREVREAAGRGLCEERLEQPLLVFS